MDKALSSSYFNSQRAYEDIQEEFPDNNLVIVDTRCVTMGLTFLLKKAVALKNEGKSMGLLIEKYIGKTGKKLFLLFCWLFTLIVIAAFADMVAGTFNAYAPEKTAVERLERNGTRPCLHCCSLCNRHECTACNKQSNLDLSGICLHLSCRCPSDVASDAAA